MKIGLLQPYLFPYLGYFQLIHAVDTCVLYDDVQYIKGGWINRNNILIGGQKILFTIPLHGASPNKLISEIDIQDDFSKFLKTVGMAYSRAPYSQPVTELLQKICAYEDKNLARFTGNSLQEIVAYIGIGTKFIYSSKIPKDASPDAQGKVIAVSKALGCDMYINPIGGQELYAREVFRQQGIELLFLKTHFQEYRQLGKVFVPGLSIIDIMMFNSPEEIQQMLSDYELV
jgi:WbqC-like protein family